MTGAEGACVSSRTVKAAETGDWLPARSRIVTETWLAPSLRVGKLSDHLPSVPIAVRPTSAPSRLTTAVAPFSPVPSTVGLVFEVMPSPGVPVSGLIPVITPATGALVSMTTLKATESAPLLPAWSLAWAVKADLPSAKVTSYWYFHNPVASANARPIFVPFRITSTRLLASAVPAIRRVLSLVTPSVALSPVSFWIPVMTGNPGARVSTSILSVWLAFERLPAASTDQKTSW